MRVIVFFFNDAATTEIYTLSLHDALPIYEAFQKAYAATARDPEAWLAFVERWLEAPSHAEYLERLDTMVAEA